MYSNQETFQQDAANIFTPNLNIDSSEQAQIDALDTISQDPIAMRKLLVMLGVPIDNLTMDETLERIEQFVLTGRATGKTHQVATVNTDFLVKAADDDNLRNLLQNADMCTADGMPLVWGSKLFGAPLKERVAGSDMVPAIAERAAQQGFSLYLMGAGPGVAAKAAKKLQSQYEGLKIAGVSAPFWIPGEQMDEAVLADIKRSKPDILLVAFGNPKQELWIQEYGEIVGVPVMIGIGASLDFIVGTVKRAPVWMQKTGLEWASRLVQEPQRLWRRYVSNFTQFGPLLARQWWVVKQQEGELIEQPFELRTRSIDHTTVLNISGKFGYKQVKEVVRTAQQSLENRPNLTINLAEVTKLDCAAIGSLMQIEKSMRDSGGTFRLVGIQASTQRIFSALQVGEFFNINEDNMLQGWQPGY